MRQFAGIIVTLAIAVAGQPVAAQADGKMTLSQKAASQVFWRYAQCVARREPRTVSDLLAVVYWGAAQMKAAKDLAVRNNSCSLLAGDELSMPPALLRSALASAVFIAQHEGQPLPSYADTPIRFGDTAVATAGTSEEKQRALLMGFAECVFRNRPEDVRKLLESEPFTQSENEGWAPLMSVLGACLPAAEGTQLRFSRMTLRGLLGEIAYELDRVLRPTAAPQSETVH